LGILTARPEEADVTSLLDTAHDVRWSICEGSDGFDIVARAQLIAADRDSKLECFVWALRVVYVAPAIEGALGSSEIGEGWPRQHLGLEAAVEALVCK
jgi:hypothetical protein